MAQMQKNQARGSGEISSHQARGLPNPLIIFSKWHRNFIEARAAASGIGQLERNFRQLGAEWAAKTRQAHSEGINAYREFFFQSMRPASHGILGSRGDFNYGAARRRAEIRFMRSIIEHLEAEGITGSVEINSFIHGASRNFSRAYKQGFNNSQDDIFWASGRRT